MSELKTNKISTNDQNNVAIDNALGLKSYTTTQRNALTSVAGDTIYNTTTGKVEYYNGSAWQQTGADTFNIEYVVVAGGGGANAGYAQSNGGGGGGAGGYLSNVPGENSGGGFSASNRTMSIPKSTAFNVSIGGGGAGDGAGSVAGNASYFSNIVAVGGGGACGDGNASKMGRRDGGSGGGGLYGNPTGVYETRDPGNGVTGQGYNGGYGGLSDNVNRGPGGGGGGAGAVGGNGQNNSSSTCNAGDGGAGVTSSITGSAITRAGGGGGGIRSDIGSSVPGTGGTGGGGNGGSANSNGNNGTVNTGGGGGGGSGDDATYIGGSGGSGVVILRWATADATIGGTRTGLTDGGVQTDGTDSYIVFTAGTGTITFS